MLPLLAHLWALPTTLVGLLPAVVARLAGARWRVVDGVLEVCGGTLLPRLLAAVPLPRGAEAMALGHVILARDAACLERLRPHERVHVRQAERWGPLFIPAYLGIGAWLWLTGRGAYADHPFEREARSAGHTAPPV